MRLIHKNNLKITIPRLLIERLQHLCHLFPCPTACYNDGYKRISRCIIFYVVYVSSHRHRHTRQQMFPSDIIFQCGKSRLIFLCVLAIPLRRSPIMNPLMIQHPSNMPNLCAMSYAPEQHIIVLCTIVLTPESAFFKKEASSYHTEMSYVVAGAQQFHVKIRFKPRFFILISIF